MVKLRNIYALSVVVVRSKHLCPAFGCKITPSRDSPVITRFWSGKEMASKPEYVPFFR
jgi:hypothetical protein